MASAVCASDQVLAAIMELPQRKELAVHSKRTEAVRASQEELQVNASWSKTERSLLVSLLN